MQRFFRLSSSDHHRLSILAPAHLSLQRTAIYRDSFKAKSKTEVSPLSTLWIYDSKHYQPTSATREYVFSLPLFDEVDTEASLSELSSRSFMAVLRKKAPKVVSAEA
ncbi:hypothetical protein EV424DRAFT_1648555 [Suillus variegatus]|nr:hypothetical protein EV424DRAFT_1648555 [Suillus variegatus]